MKYKRMHWLASVINENGFTVGAEVGTALGDTTLFLMQICNKLERLYAVDDWRRIPVEGSAFNRDDMEQVFRRKLGAYMGRTKILKGVSWEQASRVSDGELDFVFIDASHDQESVEKDIRAWLPKVKDTGILSGHDLHFEGVVAALDNLHLNYERAGVDNCWWISVKEALKTVLV